MYVRLPIAIARFLRILLYSIGSISGGSLTTNCMSTNEELVSADVYTTIPLRNRSGHASAKGKVGKTLLATVVDCL